MDNELHSFEKKKKYQKILSKLCGKNIKKKIISYKEVQLGMAELFVIAVPWRISKSAKLSEARCVERVQKKILYLTWQRDEIGRQ